MSKPTVGPWFPCFASDFLGSSKCALMTPEQRGGYFWLLLHAWGLPDCALPADDRSLSLLSGLGEARWCECKDQILECFAPHPKLRSRLINAKLHAIWLTRMELKETAVTRGRKGAMVRWHSLSNASSNASSILRAVDKASVKQ